MQTRVEILLLFAFIVLLLAVFTAYFLIQRRAARRQLAARSREMLEHLLAGLDLTTEDVDLLGRLARYLGRSESEYMLLTSRHIFDSCARKMLPAEGVSEARLNRLRLKIGFRITRPEETAASSAELPEGSPVLLAAAGSRRVRGTLLAQGPAGMLVSLTPAPGSRAIFAPPAGTPLRLYFHNSAGIFSFPTKVLSRGNDTVELEHSSAITRYQRRRYYRRKERLPAFIKRPGSRGPSRPSFLLDLGGGGASIENVLGPTKPGDLVEVSFSPMMNRLTVTGRVVRVSRDAKVISVKFESLSERQRDGIMRFLFRRSRGRRPA